MEVDPNNTAFKAIDGNLFTADGKTLLYAKASEGSFTVPDGTEVMERYSMAAVADAPFMDSSGIGRIMGRYQRMQELGGTLTVANPSAEHQKIFKAAGLNKLVKEI